MGDGTATVDYDALAQKHGSVSTSAPAVDYDALASKHGAVAPVSKTEQPQPEGFIESLGRGLPGYDPNDSFAAIKDAGRGLYHIFTHPIDSAQLTYHGILDPMALTQEKAIARMKQAGISQKLAGALEYAESEVPIVGPMLAKAGEQFEAGNIPGGLGSTTAAAIQLFGPKAMEKGTSFASGAASSIWSKVSPVKTVEEALGRQLSPAEADAPRPGGQIQPALNNTPREVLQHASDEGIKLTPGQATEDAMAQNLQKAGTTAAIGGKELTAALRENQVKFGQSVTDFMDKADPKRAGLSAESAGEQIKNTAQVAKSVAHDNASLGYEKIDYLMDRPVNPASISSAWNKLKVNLPMGAEEQILAQTPRSMRAVVEDLLSGHPEGFKPTFSQGIQLRKFFRELGETQGLPDQTQGIFRQMSGATDTAMESSAASEPHAGAAQDWRDANAGWRDYATKYGNPQSVLYKVLRSNDPARTVTMLQNAPATDIEILKAEHMDAALEPLKRQVLQDIAQSRFNIGHDGLGGYSDAYLKTLFNPADVKELYLKADLANRLKYDPNPSGTGANISSVSQLGLWNQTKMSAAAKMSLPRDPLSFLPGGTGRVVRMTPFPAAETAKTPIPISPITGGPLARPDQLFRRATQQ